MEEIFPGVFVVVNEQGGANLGFIIGKKGVVVIDTSLFVRKARELKEYIASITRKEIIAVFNTHYHPDHSFGNSAFDCQVLGHEITRDFMESMGREYIESIIAKFPDMSQNFQEFVIKPPNLTFRKSKKIDLGDRSINLIHVGGHTADSSVALIKPFNVLFAGDVVINDYHPEIVSDSDLKVWLKVLKRLLKLDPDLVIPGHGGIGTKQCIVDMSNYLKKIQEISESIGNNKVSVLFEEVVNEPNFTKRKFPELFVHTLKVLKSSAEK